MPTQVIDLMTSPVLTTTPGTKAVDAALVIALNDITALPVVDQGRVVGMFNEANLLRLGAGPASPLVREVMVPVALAAEPGDDAAKLAEAMRERGVLSVPVLRDDQLVGIITRRDLIRAGVPAGAVDLLDTW